MQLKRSNPLKAAFAAFFMPYRDVVMPRERMDARSGDCRYTARPQLTPTVTNVKERV